MAESRVNAEVLYEFWSPAGQRLQVRSWYFPFTPDAREVITVLSGLHGDEQAGVAVCIRLIRTLSMLLDNGEPLSANYRVIPLANPLSALVGERNSPIDHGDWNRLRPHATGDLGERIIAELINACSSSKVFIDVHGGDRFVRHVPEAVCFHRFFPKMEAESQTIAERLNLPLIRLEQNSERSPFHHTLACRLAERGVIPLIVELGVGARIYEDETDDLTNAIIGLSKSGGTPTSSPSARTYLSEDLVYCPAPCGGLFFSPFTRLVNVTMNVRDVVSDGFDGDLPASSLDLLSTAALDRLADIRAVQDVLEGIIGVIRRQETMVLWPHEGALFRYGRIKQGDLLDTTATTTLGELVDPATLQRRELFVRQFVEEGGLLTGIRRHPLAYEGSTLATIIRRRKDV